MQCSKSISQNAEIPRKKTLNIFNLNVSCQSTSLHFVWKENMDILSSVQNEKFAHQTTTLSRNHDAKVFAKNFKFQIIPNVSKSIDL